MIEIMTKKMKNTADIFARRLALTLLAVLTTSMAWAQFSGGSGTEDDPYLISSAEDWTTLTNNVNNYVGADAYYLLTNDLSLGTETEPITTVVGNAKTKQFKGTFDGGFHTIHLIMNRHNDYAALFGTTDNATIKNLTVDGTITTDHKFAGAFIGYANNTSNNSTSTTRLINCISRVHISCDNIYQHIDINGNVVDNGNRPFDCTHGGLVGQNEAGYISFENCIFEGSITDSKDEKTANKCTGFIAWVNKGVTYTNCLMAGTIDVVANNSTLPNSMATFHRMPKSGVKPKYNGNCYFVTEYTYPGETAQGTAALTELPENTIARKYTVGRTDYYVPVVDIHDYSLSFYGWDLVEGVDYLINIEDTYTEHKLTITGINNFTGTYVQTVQSSIDINVTQWDADTKTGWMAISSPINGQAFSGVTKLTNTPSEWKYNIYRYDETKRQWQEHRNSANLFNSFENGRGYIYRTEYAGGFVGFNGTCNTEPVEVALTVTDPSGRLAGFNLIGNPFNNEIYKGVSFSNEQLVADYYVLTTSGTWEVRDDSEAIPVATAIFVQAKESTKLTISDTKEVPAAKASFSNIWFTVANEEHSDVARVSFREGRGLNKIQHYNEEAPMLYVINEGEHFASANMSDGTSLIELGFETKAMGQYTLSFKSNSNFNYMHLIDKLTGADIDMLAEGEYTFVGSSYDDSDRFIVKLNENAGLVTANSEIFAWQNGNNVIVEGEGELQVFDVTGRMMTSVMVNGIETVNIPSQGVYVFRMVGNEIKTQKIVVR